MPARRLADRLAGLAPSWDSLADRLAASPFKRPGWIGAWWESFGTGELSVLSCTESSTGLTAAMPIALRRGAACSPCNWHSPEYGPVATDQHSCRRLLDQLFESRPQLVSLRLLDAGDPALEQLCSAAEDKHYHVAFRTHAQCPVALLDGDWSSYARALSRNLRQDVQRSYRRLAEFGPVSLEVSHSARELEAGFALERLGWKGARGTAMDSRARTRRFYERVAGWAESRGWLRVVFLRAGSRRIAFHLALEHGDSYVPLKGGFDPEFGACSPGKLIIHATLERAFNAGLRRYEFLAGAEHYKLRWATDTVERVHFRAFAPTLRGASIRFADARGRTLAGRAVAAARGGRVR